MNNAVILNDVTLSYRRHPAVHHLSGAFEAGSLTAIAGPNGGGKSTLLKAIAGILSPDSGIITRQDAQKGRLAYLPQASEVQRDMPISVKQLVATGSWPRCGAFGRVGQSEHERVRQALHVVGLDGFAKRNLEDLSIGQFQRVLFARIVVQDAPLILLDEPFSALDADTASQLVPLLTQWHGEGRTVICVLHDIGHIRAQFPSCLLLARECIAWGASGEVLTPENLERARCFHAPWGSAHDVCKEAGA